MWNFRMRLIVLIMTIVITKYNSINDMECNNNSKYVNVTEATIIITTTTNDDNLIMIAITLIL